MARGPLDTLVRSHATYLTVAARHGQDDPIIWAGIERLARVSLIDPSAKGVRMAERVLHAVDSMSSSKQQARIALDLREFVRQQIPQNR